MILPISRDTQYTRDFSPSYGCKNKTTRALAKLVQSLHGFKSDKCSGKLYPMIWVLAHAPPYISTVPLPDFNADF